MRLVADIRPATVLMENVKGLLIARKGAYRDEVVASFRALGYQVTGQVLLAADYGVPQLRERVFFAASRLGGDLTLPLPTHGRPTMLPVQAGQLRPYVTLDEAIGDLPYIGELSRVDPLPYSAPLAGEYQRSRRRGSSEVYNHVSRPLSVLARSVIEQLGPGRGCGRSRLSDCRPGSIACAGSQRGNCAGTARRFTTGFLLTGRLTPSPATSPTCPPGPLRIPTSSARSRRAKPPGCSPSRTPSAFSGPRSRTRLATPCPRYWARP